VSLNALVADDDCDARTLLANLVRRAGYEVVEVEDGCKLVACALLAREAKKPFDVIVSDVGMPSCTGTEALLALRERGLDVPFIMITAFTDPKTWRAASSAGAHAVLPKPLVPARLLELLDTLSKC
jgi:CheY-like chemotaxis protein